MTIKPLAALAAIACFPAILLAEDPSQPPHHWKYCQPWTVKNIAGADQTGLVTTHISDGDGGPALQAKMKSARGIAVGRDGTIYVACNEDHVVRKITPDGIINRVAGLYGVMADYNQPGTFGDGGPATNAKLYWPAAVAVDRNDNLFILDLGRIRKVTKEGIIHTYAGTTVPSPSDSSLATALADFRRTGPATSTPLVVYGAIGQVYYHPHLSLVPDGTLYIHAPLGIIRITPDGTRSPFIESGVFSPFTGSPVKVGEYQFTSIAVNSKNELYAAGAHHPMRFPTNIFRISSDGTVVSVLGGADSDPADPLKGTGPVTPGKALAVYTIGLDLQDRLWWSGPTNGPHFSHLDADNIIRWSGYFQSYDPATTTFHVENGPAPLDFSHGATTSFMFLPDGRVVFSSTNAPGYSAAVRMLSPTAPSILPRISAETPSIEVSAKIGDPDINLDLPIDNSGTLYGALSVTYDTSLPWLYAHINTSGDEFQPGATKKGIVQMRPSKVFTPGDHKATLYVHNLGSGQPPLQIPVTLHLADGPHPNLAPVFSKPWGWSTHIAEDTVFTMDLAANSSDDGLPAPGKLTYSLAYSPPHGTAQIVGNTLTYTFNANYNYRTLGPWAWTEVRVRISDGALYTECSITIWVLPVNDPPSVNAGVDQSITLPAAAQLAGSGSDVDGFWNYSFNPTFLWTVVSGPGIVTFSDATLPTSKAFFSQPGSYVLRLTASDSVASSSDEVTLTVAAGTGPNKAPVAMNVSASTARNHAVDFPLYVHDDGLIRGLTYALVAGPAHGSVTLSGGSVRFTPAQGYSGPDSFTYKANDGQFDSNTASVTLSVIPFNEVPVVDAGPDLLVAIGETIALNGSASDPENDPLTVSWSVQSGPPGSSIHNPAAATTTATFAAEGSYMLRLSVSDGAWRISDEMTVTVGGTIPGNRAPVISSAASAVPNPAAVGTSVAFSVAASDQDGDSLSYAWSFGDGSSASGSSASHSYAAAGTFTATATVTDGRGGSVANSIVVVVTSTADPLNQMPIARISVDAQIGTAPLTVSFNASASTDPDGTVASYSWLFGDGQKGNGALVQHTFGMGQFVVTLTVTDNAGAVAQASTTISVVAVNPGDDVIDLGTVAVNRPFKVQLPIPASVSALDARKSRWSLAGGDVLPKGVRLRRGLIGGKVKAGGMFTFVVRIKGKTLGVTQAYRLKIE